MKWYHFMPSYADAMLAAAVAAHRMERSQNAMPKDRTFSLTLYRDKVMTTAKPRRESTKSAAKMIAPLTESTAAGEDPDDPVLCACPVCGMAYTTCVPSSCPHLLCDWCFSMETPIGIERGYWPTKVGTEVLCRFDVAIRTLSHMLDYAEWPSREAREAVISALPIHLRYPSEKWGDLLSERIGNAPGYLASNEGTANGMVSDTWTVDWAKDAKKAARPVIAAFRVDLKILAPIIRKAQRTVLSK